MEAAPTKPHSHGDNLWNLILKSAALPMRRVLDMTGPNGYQ